MSIVDAKASSTLATSTVANCGACRRVACSRTSSDAPGNVVITDLKLDLLNDQVFL